MLVLVKSHVEARARSTAMPVAAVRPEEMPLVTVRFEIGPCNVESGEPFRKLEKVVVLLSVSVCAAERATLVWGWFVRRGNVAK
jgi:hypothetical protein